MSLLEEKNTPFVKSDTELNQPSINNNECEAKPQKKGLLNNWIFCTVMSLFSFCVTDICIDSMADLGLECVLYQQVSALIFALTYFIYYYSTIKKYDTVQIDDEFFSSNNDDDNDQTSTQGLYNLRPDGKRKYVLTSQIDGKFDWKMIGFITIAAFLSAGILSTAVLTFSLSLKADLNAGVATSIWATLPFFAAVVEYFVYKTPLQCYQIVGMTIMLIAACLVSLSEVVYGKQDSQVDSESIDQQETQLSQDDKLPLYVPLLGSLLLPIIGGIFSNFTKWVQTEQRQAALNWTMGYILETNIIVGTVAIVYFTKQAGTEHEFQFGYFWRGSLAGLFSTIGNVFVGKAIETDAPLGPIFALLNLKMVLLTVILIFVNRLMPNGMQWGGLTVGMVAALILTYHDKVLQVIRCMTTPCNRKSKE